MPSLTTPSRTYNGVVNEHTAPDKNWNYFSPVKREKTSRKQELAVADKPGK